MCLQILLICGPSQAHLQDRPHNLSKLVCKLQFEDFGMEEIAYKCINVLWASSLACKLF